MALGQAKRFRFRNTDSPRRKPINGKKLDFSTPTRTPANRDSDSDSDSLFKPKFEMNKQLKFDDDTNDMSTSDSESDVSVHEKSTTELENLDGFDDEMSPIGSKQASESPLVLRKRQRTSTRAIPNPMFMTPVRGGDAKTSSFSPGQDAWMSPIVSKQSGESPSFPASSFETPERRGVPITNPYSDVVFNNRQKRHSASSICSSISDCDSLDSGRFSGRTSPQTEEKLSDLSISRYEKEFDHKKELASGEYGSVQLVRHKLDNKFYAIKVNKQRFKPNSSDERKVREEVSAHATLNSSNYVVRYYNSWVEDGHVYIQNEFCNGGSFTEMINKKRKRGEHFTEDELNTVFSHSLKGLKFIHENKMAHLDIKPDNIFVSLNLSNPCDLSNDSGAESDDPSFLMKKMELKEAQAGEEIETTYKIGDLGHTRQVKSNKEVDEGDCRYMAPELFNEEPDTSAVQKADIFSLGCSIFEAASLQPLPKNSTDPEADGSLYEPIRQGILPYLPKYSKRFNNILRSMIKQDPQDRPTAIKLLKQISVSKKKTKVQLTRKLKTSQRRLVKLYKAPL